MVNRHDLAYRYWDLRLRIFISCSRIGRKIHSKWILRKGDKTEWSDVWRELDKSKVYLAKHKAKLDRYARKRSECLIRKYS